MDISVVIPTHDRSDRVVGAVDSVLRQTGAAVELIVVDDGSTDDTGKRLAAYDGRLRYCHREHRGVSAARNYGAGIARGEWLAFLDSDDEWVADKLEAQRDFHAANPAVPISQTAELWIRNGVRVNPCKYHAKPSGDVFLPSLDRCLVSPSAVMMRRDLFLDAGGFDEGLPVCEDYDLWLRLSCRTTFGLIDRPLVVKYGGHADQLSRRYWGMDRYRVQSLVKLLDTAELDGGHRRAAVRTLAAKCSVLANGARKRGRVAEADEYEALVARYADD